MRIAIPVTLLFSFAAFSAGAAPKAGTWERWSKHDPTSDATIDHSAWSDFLRKYIVRDQALDLNRVRYAAITGADRDALRDYIRRLERTAISGYRRDVQLAYWLNLYNAITVALILDHYPVASIRDIGGGLGGLLGGGVWERRRVRVEGRDLSLDDIEHRILRPIWDHGLIHYGVNCASVGCPNLLAEPYTGANVYDLLRENARAYVNSPRGVRFQDGRLIVSTIYEWFAEDFGGSETAVISHLRRFAEPARSARLDAAGGIDGYAYDWALNDGSRKAGRGLSPQINANLRK